MSDDRGYPTKQICFYFLFYVGKIGAQRTHTTSSDCVASMLASQANLG